MDGGVGVMAVAVAMAAVLVVRWTGTAVPRRDS